MPPAKRARACDACHSIKIKCALGSTGEDPPCERCVRLGKECVVSPPIRQKDRVAELEAKIEALTKMLDAQNIRVNTPETLQSGSAEELTETPPKTPPLENSKKRKIDAPSINGAAIDVGVSSCVSGGSLAIDSGTSRSFGALPRKSAY